MYAQVETGGTFVNRSSLSSRMHCCQHWWVKREVAKCELHPLIHTLPKFALAQDAEKKKAEPKTPQESLRSEQSILIAP